jgi:hypothetical protein
VIPSLTTISEVILRDTDCANYWKGEVCCADQSDIFIFRGDLLKIIWYLSSMFYVYVGPLKINFITSETW